MIELLGESKELSNIFRIIPENSIKSKELALKMIQNGCRNSEFLLDEKLNKDNEIIVERVSRFRR